eukprot:246175_1
MPSTCSWCKSLNATSVCSRCKSAYYCNSECQRKQWNEHKKVCKKRKSITPITNTINNININSKPSSITSKPNTNDQINPKLCKYFGSKHGCNYKHDCKYSHKNPNSVPFCSNYYTVKGCKFMNKCKFRHKYHIIEDQQRDQESVLDTDIILDSFQEVITLLGIKIVNTQHDIYKMEESKVNDLLNKIAHDIPKDSLAGQNLDSIISLRESYRASKLLEFHKILEDDPRMDAFPDVLASHYAMFNCIILLSQLKESIKLYEKKFQQKNSYQVDEFGAMYCQYCYCKDQKQLILSELVSGTFMMCSMDKFVEYYFANHDDGGYSGLIPSELCQELANQFVKPWEADAMAVIGVLHMDPYQCVNKIDSNSKWKVIH